MNAIETNAATIEKVVKQLAAWGWSVELVNGWRTRHNRQATLVWESVTVHHTGAGPVSTSYMTNPTDRPALVVLCNAHVTKDHHIRIIAAGGASHAGMSDRTNYAKMRAGQAPMNATMKPGADSATFSANRLSFGIEVDNNRRTPEWDDWMRGAVVALCAALHVVNGWKPNPAPRVITHKELTRRKPGDPIMDAGHLRLLVRDFLNAPYGPQGSKPYVLGDRILGKDNGNDSGADVAELAALLKARGYDVGTPATEFGPAMDKAVRDFQTKQGFAAKDIDGLVGPKTLAALRAPEPTPPPAPQEPQEPVVKSRTFWAGHANLQAERFGGLKDDTSVRGKYLKSKMGCSMYTFCEVPRKSRDAIKKVFEPGWKSYAQGYVADFWAASWKFISQEVVTFNDNGIHGAVRVTLQDVTTGLEMDVISVHIRPNDAFPASWSKEKKIVDGKLKDVAKALTLVRKDVPTLLDGDWNTARAAAVILAHRAHFTRATPAIDTSDDPGEQKLDAMYVCGNLVVNEVIKVNPGKISDHIHFKIRATLSESN